MDKVMYVTDDRDHPKEDQRSLVIFRGGNGDWYVQVADVEGRATDGVRLCTSGGASNSVPGLTGAIAEAYRCIEASQNGQSRRPNMSTSYDSLKTEVDAWRAKFPHLQFENEVLGFQEVEPEETSPTSKMTI